MGSWVEQYKSWEAWAAQEDETPAQAARACTGCRGLDRTEERKLFELPTAEKIECCSKYLRRGDALRAEGQVSRASLWYQRGLSYYEYTFPDEDADVARLEAVRLSTLLGLAGCCFRSRLLLDVLDHCRQALRIDEANVEALCLRAATYRLLDRYDEARADVDRVFETAPQRAKAELEMLNARRRGYQRRVKDQSRRIVAGLDEAQGVLPPVRSAKDRDALDDIYEPIDAAAHLVKLKL